MAIDSAELIGTIGRLGLALLLGSAIGFERQWHQKMAGLRTNALVALGACGFVVFSDMVGQGDPTRIAAQVVSGIGFLGAGVILQPAAEERVREVRGLTTAACVWVVACIGAACGAGMQAEALLVTVLVLALLYFGGWIEHRIERVIKGNGAGRGGRSGGEGD